MKTTVPVRRTLAIGAAGLAAWAAQVAPAAAADSTLGCRASAARGVLNGFTVEPVRANAPTDPCRDDKMAVVEPTTVGPVSVNAIGAFTNANAPTEAPGAAALASIAGMTVTAGQFRVEFTGGYAEAAYRCIAGVPAASSTSRVLAVTVNGQSISVPLDDSPQSVALDDRGSFVAFNRTAITSAGITRQAAILHVVDAGELVIGEAVVTLGANPCGLDAPGGGGGGGTLPVPQIGSCPTGAAFDPARLLCIITQAGGVAGIAVASPFEGPTGGTVVPLALARQQYKSACLNGPGPQFVVVGTAARDTITGSRTADRVLSLGGNDGVDAQAGDDCVDAGIGNDKVIGGKGKDRLIGGNGVDSLSGGSDADRMDGGNGHDRLSGAAGNDLLIGGTGNDRLFGAGGADTLQGQNGNDRISTGSGRDKVTAGAGRDQVVSPFRGVAAKISCGDGRDRAILNRNEVKYARTHGCERLSVR